ncbi:caspase family protein [Aestuariispira insulae]|uniref:caspase family protein n=1 Tax=Aestuariispira insulae TaxID=1461337 RepID=UPI0015F27506|nr:caspase family protein [Aestuariispira insulae]
MLVRLLLCLFCLSLTAAAARAEGGHGSPDVAVIIGNKTYGPDVPEVSFAHRDARAFRRFARDVLMIPDHNILYFEDAKQAEILSVFGNDRSHQGKLWQYIDPNGSSNIVVYYSGHGVPGPSDGTSYLLPSDANPGLAAINGYPLEQMYRNLAKLEANSITVYLDACFTGQSPAGPLFQAASPVFAQPALPAVPDGMTVLSAAGPDQLASWDETSGHGLFTKHLLLGLAGGADQDGNGQITAQEIKSHLDSDMTRQARRELARDQWASLHGRYNTVLADLGAAGLDLAALPSDYPLESNSAVATLPENEPEFPEEGSLADFGDWQPNENGQRAGRSLVIIQPPARVNRKAPPRGLTRARPRRPGGRPPPR